MKVVINGVTQVSQKQAQQALDQLEAMTAHLIEVHMPELEDNHGGDATHAGEAPEVCSYCTDIQEAREILKAAGRNVDAITPFPGEFDRESSHLARVVSREVRKARGKAVKS